MYHIKNILTAIIFLLFNSGNIISQACCTAGTPILSSLEISSIPEKSWQFSLSYNYNYIDDVLDETQKIEGFQQRKSKSIILETGYGINHRFSINAFFPYQMQSRSGKRNNSSRNEITVRGRGDIFFLVKYNIIPLNIISQRQVAVGSGLKLPTGKSNISQNNLLLAPNLQPGTGSTDLLLWAYFYQGFLPHAPANIFINSSFRKAGKNNRYSDNSNFRNYKFGDEFTTTLGLSYKTLKRYDFSILVRYRFSKNDQADNTGILNTGGHWINLVPGINVNAGPISFRVAGEIPIYRRLNGIQLTTSYATHISIFYIKN